VQVVQLQQAAPSAQVPQQHPAPVGLTQSSSTSPQPPVHTKVSSRKRSSNGSDDGSAASRPRSRKKSGSSDGRWSKRFQWPDELHRDFVSAVFDVGLKHSSPSAILEHMTPNEAITSERVKSHLQKYRVHRQRSKREFMSSYDSAMSKFKSTPDGVLVDAKEVGALSSGEVAAHLSCSTLSETNTKPGIGVNAETAPPLPSLPTSNTNGVGPAPEASPVTASAPSQIPQPAPTGGSYGGGALHLPQLTEEEKRSPIGAALGYLMGLFFALDQQLAVQRAGATGGSVVSGTQGSTLSASAPETALAHPTTKYAPNVAAPALGPSAPLFSVPAPMPPPQAAPASVPPSAPFQAQYINSAPAPAPANSFQALPQDQAPSSSANPPATSGSAGQSSVVLHPTYQPPPANARHPTQPHLPLHSHSASIIEENDMMKRDMRSQMALQNKMRAMKEQEQRKYRNKADATAGSPGAETKSKDESKVKSEESAKQEAATKVCASGGNLRVDEDVGGQSQIVGESSNGDGSTTARPPSAAIEPHVAGTNEAAPSVTNRPGSAATAETGKDGGHTQPVSGAAPEFWNSDVVDEQLFEFLMS